MQNVKYKHLYSYIVVWFDNTWTEFSATEGVKVAEVALDDRTPSWGKSLTGTSLAHNTAFNLERLVWKSDMLN